MLRTMPELPEVETVRAGLERLLAGAVIRSLTCSRPDLRRPIPADLGARLSGQPVSGVRRRAKYLILATPVGGLLCHLGMTGTWRIAPPGDERPHDHCRIDLADGRRLVFRDPRRFGLLDWIDLDGRHPDLDRLGPEPLDPGAFHVDYLRSACRGRKLAIKPLIMDQEVVVGVGNIYAQEALFRARIKPTAAAGRIPAAALAGLVTAIREILAAAIAAGGSTISDFQHAGGEEGWFQHQFQVYAKAGQPCPACARPLRGGVIGGRTTTWCRWCQR
jgi:formamidopyrimidine-DNA glycosylase